MPRVPVKISGGLFEVLPWVSFAILNWSVCLESRGLTVSPGVSEDSWKMWLIGSPKQMFGLMLYDSSSQAEIQRTFVENSFELFQSSDCSLHYSMREPFH